MLLLSCPGFFDWNSYGGRTTILTNRTRLKGAGRVKVGGSSAFGVSSSGLGV